MHSSVHAKSNKSTKLWYSKKSGTESAPWPQGCEDTLGQGLQWQFKMPPPWPPISISLFTLQVKTTYHFHWPALVVAEDDVCPSLSCSNWKESVLAGAQHCLHHHSDWGVWEWTHNSSGISGTARVGTSSSGRWRDEVTRWQYCDKINNFRPSLR